MTHGVVSPPLRIVPLEGATVAGHVIPGGVSALYLYLPGVLLNDCSVMCVDHRRDELLLFAFERSCLLGSPHVQAGAVADT